MAGCSFGWRRRDSSSGGSKGCAPACNQSRRRSNHSNSWSPNLPKAPKAEKKESRPVPFVCEDDVRAAILSHSRIVVGKKTIITPSARGPGRRQRYLCYGVIRMSVDKATLDQHLAYTSWATNLLLKAVASIPADQFAAQLQYSGPYHFWGRWRTSFAADRIWFDRVSGRKRFYVY